MKAEVLARKESIDAVIITLRRCLDWDVSLQRLDQLNQQAEDPQLWDNPEKAQKLMQERDLLSRELDEVRALETDLQDILDLITLAEEENDTDTLNDSEVALEALDKKAQKLRIKGLLSGPADGNDCFLEIHAGAGGTEAQDWAQMLLRLYTRWAEQRGFKVTLLQESPGEEAGIKSVTLKFMGDKAFGWTKTESGVHRLVRISPFDSNARRHTSFASVWVYPVVDDSIDITVEEKDLRVDTFRASGAGGQHVNTTDSAIRITHIPTGIVVQCQSDRSQHRNRAEALNMLKARLYEQELRRREEELQSQNAAKTDIGWGHQIRSYVLHPYQLVKDLRTHVETGNTADVLDGGIDLFIEAALANRVS
ncbi:peptide chain release factor 2 [Alphaproteobacteria bacterium]|nr:peptide chain release factor 2 [Alphaproteobacteria bacterium]